jgi:hypothetical protein
MQVRGPGLAVRGGGPVGVFAGVHEDVRDAVGGGHVTRGGRLDGHDQVAHASLAAKEGVAAERGQLGAQQVALGGRSSGAPTRIREAYKQLGRPRRGRPGRTRERRLPGRASTGPSKGTSGW